MAEYPAEFAVDAVLRDGGVARIRPIVPDDRERLYELFQGMGQRSRYFRFFQEKDDLSPRELEYFTNVDYESRMAFVVLLEDKMIGVGRYDRDQNDPGYAEIAFAVVDAHQSRGIGTQLLQLMTAYARTHGIVGFKALVLPDNVQMIRMFRHSGYEIERTMEEGIYSVSFPVAQSKGTRAAEEERERRAIAASLNPIFYPRSIAVVGASRNAESIGGRLFHNLLSGKFSGPIYPVNPAASYVHSVKAYKTVMDIPDPVDLAFIVVPAPFVVPAVKECAEKGVQGVVVISAGFSETGPEGAALERQLVETVRDAGMRMVGPNCMGVLNTDPRVVVDGQFSPFFPPPGNVAMSSQSGALGIAILDYAIRNKIGISSFVSVGNKGDISGNDLLLYWEGDPNTDVIVLYLESFGNPRRFGRLARRIARKKPIIAVKSGRTKAGTRAASSHTGALASVDVAVEALFNQAGVIRTPTLEDLFDVAVLLASQPIPRGRRVGILTNAGGPGILAADALESHGLEVPEFSAALRANLAQGLEAEASTRNPVDMIASAGPDEYRHGIETMLASDEIDSLIVSYIPATPGAERAIAEVVRNAAADYEGDKPLLSVFMSAENPAELLSDERVKIPTYQFPEAAAVALARVVRHGEWLAKPEGTVPDFEDVNPDAAREVAKAALERLGGEGGWLDQPEVEEILLAFGLHLPASTIATSAREAVEFAKDLKAPVVMKVVSPSALHKSDVGGVVLGVEGDKAIRDSYQQLMSLVDDARGVMVQEMVTGGLEVLVGMTEDPAFGPLIVFGMGGVLVELVGDVAFRINPVTDLEAAEMVRSIKSAQLLDGYRSSPAADVDALEQVILRVSALAEAVPEISEMDLNPVKVLAPGEGVVLVDARVHVQPVGAGWTPELVDLPGLTNPVK
jgi:acetyl coenzyme A synthetase (ADP forming)-like protein